MHWQATPVPPKIFPESLVFDLEDVSYTYPSGSEALRGVSLSVVHGEKIALVGQNGSGKTTLAKILCGLISPTRGRIIFDGRPVVREELRHLRRRVGILFQDPDDHLFCPRLLDDVLFGPLNYGVPMDRALDTAHRMLELVGLKDQALKAPHHLSYGQRKRGALAAILACVPSVLILDEPTANLDAKNTEKLLEVLSGFSGTLLCISHDLLFLYELCRRAVVLQRGALHHDTDFDALIAHRPSLREHGLDFTFRFRCCMDFHAQDTPQNPGAAHGHPAFPRPTPEGGGASRAPLMELRDYSFRYADGTWGLRRLSLHVHEGERVALLGENGAGKSTLASVLAGIRSGFGIYRFRGEVVRGRLRKDLWRRVGIVFQDSMDQVVSSNVFDEVAFGLKHLGVKGADLRRRVHEALARAGLEGMADRVPHHLSGGERKRLSLAAVLAMDPQVLILDEPTANLDPENEERLLGILDEIQTTLILISHDLCFVSALTDRALVLHQGCLVEDVPTVQLLMDERLQSRYGVDVTYHHRCCRHILAMQVQWR